jgi:hypothetical protein
LLKIPAARGPSGISPAAQLKRVLGNIVGGTVLFALISYAQVMKEI